MSSSSAAQMTFFTEASDALTPDEPSADVAVSSASGRSAWGAEGLEGLPPLTKAQAFHWRQVCGAISLAGIAGLANEQWPADLNPTKPTIKLMTQYGLVVRRGHAWHLRRHWLVKLTALRLAAVDTPPLSPVERPAPGLPTYAELEAWETVCRWLDAQPKSRARLPFTGLSKLGDVGSEDEMPVALLRQMRHYRLVRHTSACEWVLARQWKERLLRLHRGSAQAECEPRSTQLQPSTPAPRSLVAGIDTWVLNWKVEDALPQRLRRQLDELQATAQEEESEQDTPWLYDGVPLRMYRYGTKAESGGGVSWSYVLINPSLRLVIRKAPLGGIIAQATLGSECLWRLTALHALDQLHLLIRRMWAGQKGQWQVSQVHLAHDVADLPIEHEQLARYVSRSKKRTRFEAAQAEIAQALAAARAAAATDGERNVDDALVPLVDWDELYATAEDDLLLDDPFDGMLGPGEYETVRIGKKAADALEESVEERAVTTHEWGRRLSGVTWSPGGVISFVQYDKTLQGRLTGKRHMEVLWRSRGWDGTATVTRNEARLRREALRELANGLRSHLQLREPATRADDLQDLENVDDPWVLLRHLAPIFAAVVGTADEGCPDAVNTAWLRRIIPNAEEPNRSRWDTDPAWRVVQAAPFDQPVPAPVRRLVRRKQRAQNVAKLDGQAFGIFVSRTAELHPNGGQYDISKAVAEAYVALEAESRKPNKDFGELVRQRRKERGLPVPICDKVLPLRVIQTTIAPPAIGAIYDASAGAMDDAVAVRPQLQREFAAFRTQQALAALEDAERRQRPLHELEVLEEAYLRELSTYTAVVAGSNSSPALQEEQKE